MEQRDVEKRDTPKIVGSMLVFLLATVCFSVVQGGQTPDSETTASTMEKSEMIQLAAQRWQLSTQEYQRYLELMRGPLGRWNPTLDPVLALGIAAESEVERQRFAEHYAQQEQDLTEKTLAFEWAYREAFARLFPDVTVIDEQRLQPYYQHQRFKKAKHKNAQQAATTNIKGTEQLQPGDRLLYFPASTCGTCGDKIVALYKRIKHLGIVIDIYVRETSNDDDVRAWASDNDIAIDWITSGKVTLNRDNGMYQDLKNKTPSILAAPTFFLSRERTIFSLDEAKLGLR